MNALSLQKAVEQDHRKDLSALRPDDRVTDVLERQAPKGTRRCTVTPLVSPTSSCFG